MRLILLGHFGPLTQCPNWLNYFRGETLVFDFFPSIERGEARDHGRIDFISKGKSQGEYETVQSWAT